MLTTYLLLAILDISTTIFKETVFATIEPNADISTPYPQGASCYQIANPVSQRSRVCLCLGGI
ncbi:MAG: hypothetical protein HC849_16965 [Oscillatoriales cyanobacterium RU_3_3]|nr:hypothetical protein [Oscillatoriales cyanobacterium RU_3_3]